MPIISSIRSREILDSRGNPTVEVDIYLSDGTFGRGIVPSGASTGKAEALELRDGDPKRYHGRGVRRAIENVMQVIAPAVIGMQANNQWALDARLCELDGTDNKSRLGANATLGVSLAVARAAAASAGLPLYRYLGGERAVELPVPMVNIASGGLHGGGNIDFQDFQVIPLRARRYSEALHDVVLIYQAMKDVLKARGVYSPGVADEGGYAPRLASNAAGFERMVEAFERAGFEPGKDAAIAVDVAASHFYQNGRYYLSTEREEWSSSDLVGHLAACVACYPILSIEDGVAEDDAEGWKLLTKTLGKRCQLIGDDLFVTNPRRLAEGIQQGVANAVLVKMNQIGTLSETLEVIRLAQRAGYGTVVSARSGETEDDSMSDLAVGTGAGQLKVGAITRSERLAKYNRLLRIEEQLGGRAVYREAEVFSGYPGFLK
jgi:enolase